MYDLSFFRNNLDAIAKRLADRSFTLDVEAFRKLDAERRAALTESEQLKAQKNEVSREVGRLNLEMRSIQNESLPPHVLRIQQSPNR